MQIEEQIKEQSEAAGWRLCFTAPVTCGDSSYDVELLWAVPEGRLRIAFAPCEYIPPAARRIAGCNCCDRLRELRRQFAGLYPSAVWTDRPPRGHEKRLPDGLKDIFVRIRAQRAVMAKAIWRELVGEPITRGSVDAALDHPSAAARWAALVLIGQRRLPLARAIESRIAEFRRNLKLPALWALMRLGAESSVAGLAASLPTRSLGIVLRMRLVQALARIATDEALGALGQFYFNDFLATDRQRDPVIEYAKHSLLSTWADGQTGGGSAWGFLVRAFEIVADANDQEALEKIAQESLGKCDGAGIVENLLTLLDGSTAVLRARSLWILSVVLRCMAGQPRAVDAFLRVCASKDADVAILAAETAHILGANAMQVLSQLVGRPELEIQLALVRVIGQAGVRQVIDVRWAFETLVQIFERSNDEMLLQAALEQMNQWFRTLFPPGPLHVFDRVARTLLSHHAEIAVRSARLLGETADARAVGPLIQAILDQRSARARAEAGRSLHRLRQFITDRDIDMLMSLLETGSSASGAAEALVAIGPAAVPRLIQAASWKYTDARAAAAMALGRIGDTRALPTIQRLMKDNNRHVRDAAVIALLDFTRRNPSFSKEAEQQR